MYIIKIYTHTHNILLGVCVYVCVYIHIYIHTHICIYAYRRTHTILLGVCVFVCVCIYIYIYIVHLLIKTINCTTCTVHTSKLLILFLFKHGDILTWQYVKPSNFLTSFCLAFRLLCTYSERCRALDQMPKDRCHQSKCLKTFAQFLHAAVFFFSFFSIKVFAR